MNLALSPPELAVLAALAANTSGLSERELEAQLTQAGLPRQEIAAARTSAAQRGLVQERAGALELTSLGARALLEISAEIEAALDVSPSSRGMEECPSIPWLTTVQTCWIDAVSINYAVEPEALAKLLPFPLEPELHQGKAWVQILMSSLRDMRPQGLFSLFGVCFYQVSYRAAVRYRSADGSWRRGGYFVRSETNHPVMRAVGNKLKEFKFHDFGAAHMTMLRHGHQLTVGVEPEQASSEGKLVGIFDTRPLAAPPKGSVWSGIDALHEPLVECFDAFGVDAEEGYVYILTIDRAPWNPTFVTPVELYSEYVDTGALGSGAARFDSVLHVPRDCLYRWRPLRRERWYGYEPKG